jgi:hypothetical protein
MKALFEVVVLPVADPDRSRPSDFASLADFHYPDGNRWVLQERLHQPG